MIGNRLLHYVLSILLASMVSSAIAQDYDLVIVNGRAMDPGTNFDAIASASVKDGRTG
jgi:hypothetical protein